MNVMTDPVGEKGTLGWMLRLILWERRIPWDECYD